MREGLLYIVVGAFFILGVGGIANRLARRDAANPHSRGLSPLTRALMLTAFGGIGATILSAALTHAWPIETRADDWSSPALNIVGIALIALGGYIVIAALTGMRKRTWAVDTDALATDGLYGRTRNPRALGWFLIYAGLALATHSLAALALAPIYLLGYTPWILLEETVLERHFGDHYRAYRQRTPRFI